MVSRISTFLLIALVLSQITTASSQEKAAKDEAIKATSQATKSISTIIIEEEDIASRPTIYRTGKRLVEAPPKQLPSSSPQYQLPAVPGLRNIAGEQQGTDTPAITREPIPTPPTKIQREQIPFPPTKIVREQIPTLPTKISTKRIPSLPAKTMQKEELLPLPQKETLPSLPASAK